MINECFIGDTRDGMRQMIANGVKVQCVVTSPPYFGLRSYLPDGVCIRADISDEKREEIIADLRSIGVFPIDHTKESCHNTA